MRRSVAALAVVATVATTVVAPGVADAAAARRLGATVSTIGHPSAAPTVTRFALHVSLPKGDRLKHYTLTVSDGSKAVGGTHLAGTIPHLFRAGGTYKVTLAVLDTHRHTATSTLRVTVPAARPATLVTAPTVPVPAVSPPVSDPTPPVATTPPGFRTVASYGGAQAVATADLNKDGITDLVTQFDGSTHGFATPVVIELGDPHGGFVPAPGSVDTITANDVAVADLNGDTYPDLVTATVDAFLQTAAIDVWRGDGLGRFTHAGHYAPSSVTWLGLDTGGSNGVQVLYGDDERAVHVLSYAHDTLTPVTRTLPELPVDAVLTGHALLGYVPGADGQATAMLEAVPVDPAGDDPLSGRWPLPAVPTGGAVLIDVDRVAVPVPAAVEVLTLGSGHVTTSPVPAYADGVQSLVGVAQDALGEYLVRSDGVAFALGADDRLSPAGAFPGETVVADRSGVVTVTWPAGGPGPVSTLWR